MLMFRRRLADLQEGLEKEKELNLVTEGKVIIYLNTTH